MRYLLLLLLPFSLFASKILSYNIYERSDRADVMITFDTPYNGIIKQSKGKNKIIIKLTDADIESSKVKKVHSDFLHSLTITPLENQTQIFATISLNVRLIASKTADSYGLRLRFTKKTTTKKLQNLKEKEPNLSALPTKEPMEISMSYYFVIAALLFAIIILFIIKKRLVNQKANAQKGWLFSENRAKVQNEKTVDKEHTQMQTNVAESKDVSIRFQKALDSTNRVVMLDFGNESYLVLMGNSNILLDKFKGNKPNSEDEFETILQERNHLLEDFLASPSEDQLLNSKQSTIDAYKERASLIYSEES